MFNGTTVKAAVDALVELPDKLHPNGFDWFLRISLTTCGLAAVAIVIGFILMFTLY